MIVGEKVELIQEVADIDAAEGVHLRKWQYAGKPGMCQYCGKVEGYGCIT